MLKVATNETTYTTLH